MLWIFNSLPFFFQSTFYVSHEWTDYSQVQDLYADGHEMASHTVTHSDGKAFDEGKWASEVIGKSTIDFARKFCCLVLGILQI